MDNQKIIRCLQSARERIREPQHWTKNTFARDKDGNDLQWEFTYNPDCYCFCLSASLILSGAVPGPVIKAILKNIPGYEHIPSFNDDPSTTHQDVLNLIDKTIKDLE